MSSVSDICTGSESSACHVQEWSIYHRTGSFLSATSPDVCNFLYTHITDIKLVQDCFCCWVAQMLDTDRNLAGDLVLWINYNSL